jgi:hypothetical protein
MYRSTGKNILFAAGIILLSGTAVAILSVNFKITNYLLTSNGGRQMSSTTKTLLGSLGQGMVGDMESANYKTGVGYVSRIAAVSMAKAAINLENAYAYPNPYKPGSGGDYDADFMTFAKLTRQATIEIFNIAGERVRKIEKDSDKGELRWVPENDSGRSLASGVYIFYVSNDNGQKKTGRFAIVK